MAQIACADAVESNFVSLTKAEGKRILKLLNEQESIIESLKSDLHETLEVVSGRLNVVKCKDCQLASMFETEDGQMFCECGATTDFHKPDWFCADGERK